jgi:hypothetical protein
MRPLIWLLACGAIPALMLGGELAIATKGELVLEESLAELSSSWRAGKGEWMACESGAIRGGELPSDRHVAVIRRGLEIADAVIEFSFRLEGAKGISLSINDAGGHLCRVTINKGGFQARKDDGDHDGPDRAVLFEPVRHSLAEGEWHTATVELVGKQMVCTIGGQVSRGVHSALASRKANLGFTVAGQSACFKDLKVWAAEPK